MDLQLNHSSPVLTDPVPVNNSRMEVSTNLGYSSTMYSSGLYLSIPRRKVITSNSDDVKRSGWLDAMRSSSPPRKKASKEISFESLQMKPNLRIVTGWYASTVLLFYMSTYLFKLSIAYCSINADEVSLCSNYIEQLTSNAKGKTIALFLDYDGTLSPIVSNPDRAFMSSGMRTAVSNVAKHFPTAIISGRSRDKVCDFVALPELYYAGSHGMDIMGPVQRCGSSSDHSNSIRTTDKQGKEVILFQPASEFLPMIDEVFRSLVETTHDIKGAKVENNKFCVSVHYRLVDEDLWPVVAEIVHNVVKGYPRLKLTYGRKVLEVRPDITWNKGKAVEFLLESLELNIRDDVLPIYVGDDKTDEDAFKVLREGNRGYGILVSSVPKETNALYSLRDPSEVKEFLKNLVNWKKTAV